MLKAWGGSSETKEYDREGNEVVNDVMRINAPGQRFTATHGITLKQGESKLFV